MSWASGLEVTGDGRGMVPLAGSAAVRLLAEQTGLVEELSAVVNPRGKMVVHDRGRVLTDTAVMVLAGGEALSDIRGLRGQDPLTGTAASTATVWRTVDSIDERMITRIDKARARTRARVWANATIPASRVVGTDLGSTIVIDIDATLVAAHSEKQDAKPNFKKGSGSTRWW